MLSSGSPGETRKIGFRVGKLLKGGAVLALNGDLGSGKTIFVQGLAQGLGLNPNDIRSPTFAIIQEHRGKIPLCHADLYRLSASEVLGVGLEEYLKGSQGPDGWVVALEWADKAKILLSKSKDLEILRIDFKLESESSRLLHFSGGNKWKTILEKLKS